MARFEDSPGLFGLGMGTSTEGSIYCDLCGTTHNKEQGEEGQSGENLRIAHFGTFQVVECCFEALENAVAAHMGAILPWYKRLLDQTQTELDERKKLVASVSVPVMRSTH